MSKKLRVIACMACLATLSTSVACGPAVVESSNNNHGKLYSIKVAVNNAGFGINWAEEMAAKYNAANTDSDYGIEIVDYGLLWADSILSDCALGNAYDMYINGESGVSLGIYQNYFEDLSDILACEVDGENNGTVQDKITNFSSWQANFSKYGTGLYAMPYSSGVVGMIIDHQEFIDNGWYCFEDEENKVLTVGRDGKRGTYDDGQPQTLAEFNEMLERIAGSAKPFIYGGGVTAYLDYIYNSIFAQYAGVDEYNAFYNYDSKGQEIKLVDGSTAQITIENGYKVYEMEALTKAYEIFESWFDYSSGKTADYIHSICKTPSASQYDTQNLFLLGYKNAATNPKSAILIDGGWWENEATSMFNTLDSVNRGRGDREYRMLLLPTFDGQKDSKSCLSVCTAGAMVIPKQNNAEKLAETKEFLKFLIKDENLSKITAMTGDIWGYDYNVATEDKAVMTPFQKNLVEMYNDKENIRIVSQALDRISSPLAYASRKGSKSVLCPVANGIVKPYCLDAVKDLSVSAITEGLKNKYNADLWSDYINEAKGSGFYS